MASDLSKLVRASRLETILNDGSTTIHIHYNQPEPRHEIWKRERSLAKGGYGEVWLEKQQPDADYMKSGETIYRAVKQIKSASSTAIMKMCKFELEALAKFSGTKYAQYFVQMFGWYEGPEFLSIAMEYCRLGDLQRFLIENNTLPEGETRMIASQIMKGLQFMHGEGFAHRDLKPGNILIKSKPPDDHWWVKICDMGISKRIEESGWVATSAIKGTRGFFAPELLGYWPSDPKTFDPKTADPFATDIWCLGELTFRMLCGKPAFPVDEQLRKYSHGEFPFPRGPLDMVGTSHLAIRFIISAMVANPEWRPDINKALKNEWLIMNVDDAHMPDETHRSASPSLHDVSPYPGGEPSGSWSTTSSPYTNLQTEPQTSSTEATAEPDQVIEPSGAWSIVSSPHPCSRGLSTETMLQVTETMLQMRRATGPHCREVPHRKELGFSLRRLWLWNIDTSRLKASRRETTPQATQVAEPPDVLEPRSSTSGLSLIRYRRPWTERTLIPSLKRSHRLLFPEPTIQLSQNDVSCKRVVLVVSEASFLAHFRHFANSSEIKLFVVIFVPGAEELPRIKTKSISYPSMLLKTISQPTHSITQQICTKQWVTYVNAFSQAQKIVGKTTIIKPFPRRNNYEHEVQCLKPEVLYIQSSLADKTELQIKSLQSWFKNDVILVTDDKMRLTAGSSEGKNDQEEVEPWWQKEERVGPGEGLMIVDISELRFVDWSQPARERS